MAIGEVPQRRALSVRVRLMLPIAIAITGMLVLGTIQVGQALNADADAGRARVLADMARTTAQLLQAGQEEVAATIKSHELGGQTGTQHGYEDQIEKTDNFASEFEELSSDVRAEVPELNAVLLTASGALGQLFDARAYLTEYAQDRSVSRTDPDVENGLALYRSVSDRVLGVADALHLYVSDRQLAEQTRALAALAGAKQAAGDKRFLAHNMMAEAERDSDDDGEVDKLPAEGLSELAVFHGVEQQRLGEFYLAAESEAKAEYSTVVVGPAVEQADQVVNNLLKGLDAGHTSTEWDDAQSDRIESLHEVESALSESLIDTAAGKEQSAQQNALLTGGIVLALAIATFVAATVFAIRISRRLRVLRKDALTAAEETLPGAVAEMTDARSERQVNEAVSTAENSAIVKRGPDDEVAGVAAAFTVVHQQALRLAADQAMLRLDVAAMMIALARRGQSLVQRQLHMIAEFTDAEHNPSSVERLAALQHLGARMRRNEENLLLLAGGDPGRRHNSAISVARAVTEAAAEIEDSPRVVVEDTADTPIVAGAVGDVVHLLAELLENAATFSPPKSHVRVATRRTVTELVVSISDEGIGLQEEQVSEINARLAEPSGLTSSLAGTMGLLVVGRLAGRHGIDVQLHSTANKGTLAVVRLPESLIATSTELGEPGKRHAFDFGGDSPFSTSPAPVAGSRSLPELMDRPDTSPVTGTGETTPGRDQAGEIVPRPRNPHADTAPAAAPGNGTVETGWFLPSTGSGDFPALPPGSLRWRSDVGDVAYDEARQVIAAAESHTPVASDGGLPRRHPGARLLPGSIDIPATPEPPAPARSSGGDFGEDGIDPDEIRSRLSGFAGGIAAASDAGASSDPDPGRSDS